VVAQGVRMMPDIGASCDMRCTDGAL